MQPQTKHIIRKTVAGFMTLWLSGFVFVFCCYASSTTAHQTDFCPMGKQAHHCDTPMDQNDVPDAVGRLEGICFDCCGYLPAVFDKARKVDRPAPVTAPLRAATTTRTLTVTPVKELPASEYRARLADKSRTFISTQVFRI